MVNCTNKKKAIIIVGLGFGDEGKGLVTDFYCRAAKNAIVIRFNGGQQAGHTVVNNEGNKHVFSNFGSGTFRGLPTYWSEYCIFSPTHFLEETDSFEELPTFYLDKHCPITTHYDVLFNRAIELTRGPGRIGSTGTGFGETVFRHNNASLKFIVADLFDEKNIREKLCQIREYYKRRFNKETKYNFDDFNHDAEDINFLHTCSLISQFTESGKIKIIEEQNIFLNKWDTYIFEGSQGILLDVNFGFKPHITKSNTTSQNAIELLRNNFNDDISIEIALVTRCYQTRHGAGPFDNENSNLELRNIEHDTNTYNEYQGHVRRSILNIELINYALKSDAQFSAGIPKHLFITCLDQIATQKIPILHEGKIKFVSHTEIPPLLDCEFVSSNYSFSPCSEDLV